MSFRFLHHLPKRPKRFRISAPFINLSSTFLSPSQSEVPVQPLSKWSRCWSRFPSVPLWPLVVVAVQWSFWANFCAFWRLKSSSSRSMAASTRSKSSFGAPTVEHKKTSFHPKESLKQEQKATWKWLLADCLILFLCFPSFSFPASNGSKGCWKFHAGVWQELFLLPLSTPVLNLTLVKRKQLLMLVASPRTCTRYALLSFIKSKGKEFSPDGTWMHLIYLVTCLSLRLASKNSFWPHSAWSFCPALGRPFLGAVSTRAEWSAASQFFVSIAGAEPEENSSGKKWNKDEAKRRQKGGWNSILREDALGQNLRSRKHWVEPCHFGFLHHQSPRCHHFLCLGQLWTTQTSNMDHGGPQKKISLLWGAAPERPSIADGCASWLPQPLSTCNRFVICRMTSCITRRSPTVPTIVQSVLVLGRRANRSHHATRSSGLSPTAFVLYRPCKPQIVQFVATC